MRQAGKSVVKNTGSLEILSGIIRVGPDHKKYGDPYTALVTFSGDRNRVILKGVNKPISIGEARAIRDVLDEHGLKCQFHDLLTKGG